MNYSEAIEATLAGNKIRRSSWENKECHLAFGATHYLRFFGDSKETIKDNVLITEDDVSAIDWEIYDDDTWEKFDDDFYDNLKKNSTTTVVNGEIFVNLHIEAEDRQKYNERAKKLIKRFGEKK